MAKISRNNMYTVGGIKRVSAMSVFKNTKHA